MLKAARIFCCRPTILLQLVAQIDNFSHTFLVAIATILTSETTLLDCPFARGQPVRFVV
jgi:hypothetical protein